MLFKVSNSDFYETLILETLTYTFQKRDNLEMNPLNSNKITIQTSYKWFASNSKILS